MFFLNVNADTLPPSPLDCVILAGEMLEIFM